MSKQAEETTTWGKIETCTKAAQLAQVQYELTSGKNIIKQLEPLLGCNAALEEKKKYQSIDKTGPKYRCAQQQWKMIRTRILGWANTNYRTEVATSLTHGTEMSGKW